MRVVSSLTTRFAVFWPAVTGKSKLKVEKRALNVEKQRIGDLSTGFSKQDLALSGHLETSDALEDLVRQKEEARIEGFG